MNDQYNHLNFDPRCQSGNPLVRFTTAPNDYDYNSVVTLIDNWGTLNGKTVRMILIVDEARWSYQEGRYFSGMHAVFSNQEVAGYGDLLNQNDRDQQIWYFQKVYIYGREFFQEKAQRDILLEARDRWNDTQNVEVRPLDGGYNQVVTVTNEANLFDQMDEEMAQLQKGYVKING